jgi:energy-converting hydrogenase Eha subunit A
MPTAILRRYTPPTCTLEVTAAQSALSLWSSQPVANRLRFQLRFDDPRLSDAQHFSIEGEGAQLDALHRVVDEYVQRLLESRLLAWGKWALTGEENSTSPATLARMQDIRHARERHAREKRHSFEPHTDLRLVSGGGLTHHLHLGSLATAESGPVATLNTLQLFDLATALDEYAADILTLPSDTRRPWSKSPWSLTQVVATFVLAAGVTAAIFRYVGHVASPTDNQTDQAIQQEIVAESTHSPQSEPSPVDPPPFADWSTVPTPNPPPTSLAPTPAPAPAPAAPPAGSTAAENPPPAQPEPGTIPPLPQLSEIQPPAPVPSATSPAPMARSQPAQPDRLSDAPASLETAPGSLPEMGSATPMPASPPPSPTDQTMFDVLPQVAQVRGYFQENWTPPADLSQTLEYRIVIDPDGSIRQILPLGQASRSNLRQLGLPAPGEPFVAPLADSQEATIRVMLTPDRTVRTFLESTR